MPERKQPAASKRVRRDHPTPWQRLPKPIVLRNISTTIGRGLGRTLGIPTVNIELTKLSRKLPHGIYACTALIHGKRYIGALHYGPRPAVNEGVAMELHVIDAVLLSLPKVVTLAVVARIRDIQDFPSLNDLQAAIHDDIRAARAILAKA